jgi:hypothetical protein
MALPTVEAALADISDKLSHLERRFALVGGLAVSFRAEVRFTRDVDLAVIVSDDNDFEMLLFHLRTQNYFPLATVEHTQQNRLATARMQSSLGIVIDLMAASCGLESEVVDRATLIEMEGVGWLPVARSEELLAMKVLSMSEKRLQDRIDARNLILYSEDLDLDVVRHNLNLITARGFHRHEDLEAKLAALMTEVEQD